MPATVISIENLSKSYRLGVIGTGTFCGDLKSWWAKKRGKPDPHSKVGEIEHGNRTGDTLWALKDINLSIQQGEAIGIIGRNGAGKSTLLKILSRVTAPTSGEVKIKGRIASLLEVGTGFHPELTGRENVFLNGAIMGMRRAEIERKFDEIVDFSGVEKFIDTPVKRYSSGMYVRLAFAVAAHLEPEILIIDEVLAVGDAQFQKKCLGKMQDVGKEGRTVLFVSHNMAAIENLCTNAILIDNGRLIMQNNTAKTIQYYLEAILPSVIEDIPLSERKDRSGNGSIRLTSFHIEDVHGSKLMAARSGMDTVLVFGYQAQISEKLRDIDIGFSIHDKETLSVLYSSYVGQGFHAVPAKGEFRCLIPRLPLAKGRYQIGARITVCGQEADWPRYAVGFLDVDSGDFYGTGKEGFGSSAPLLLMGKWTVQDYNA